MARYFRRYRSGTQVKAWHAAFRLWRLTGLAFTALHWQRPDCELWRNLPYECEVDRLAIDLIDCGEMLHQWVSDTEAAPDDIEAPVTTNEAAWTGGLHEVMLHR